MEQPDRVPVGYIARAHGLRGAVVVKPLTDDPGSRFTAGASLTTDDDRSLVIHTVADHPAGLLVGFTGIDDRSAAEALRGTQLTIAPGDRRQLGENEYWPDDLIGCSVVAASGRHVGSVVDVEFGAVQDRLVVETPDGLAGEIPLVPELVPTIDIPARLVTVDLPEGIFV